jgi:hypothetical protein
MIDAGMHDKDVSPLNVASHSSYRWHYLFVDAAFEAQVRSISE